MQVGPCISVGIHPSKQILSAKGLKRVGTHSEHAITTVWRCVRRGPGGSRRGPGGSSEPPEPPICCSLRVPRGWACALGAASSSSLPATNHANGSAYYERREATVAQARLLFRPQRWVARGGRETFWPKVSSHHEGHARATEEVQAGRLADVHNRVEKRFVSLVLLHLPGRELAHGQLIAPRQHLNP